MKYKAGFIGAGNMGGTLLRAVAKAVGGTKTHGCGSALDYTRGKARTGEGARREGAVLHGASLH